VYATDVGPSVQTVPLPAVEVRAGYWGLALTASDRGGDATAFLAWLTTPAAQSIFAAYGFTSPP